jgi:hypothetical protein
MTNTFFLMCGFSKGERESGEIDTDTEWVTPRTGKPYRPQTFQPSPSRPSISSFGPSIFDILRSDFGNFDIFTRNNFNDDSNEDDSGLENKGNGETSVVRSIYKKSVVCINGKCEVETCVNGKCEKSAGSFNV